jgi:hypothetical protein
MNGVVRIKRFGSNIEALGELAAVASVMVELLVGIALSGQ